MISVIVAVTGDYQKRETDTGNIYTYAGGVRFGSGRRDLRLRPLVQIVLGTGQDNGIGVSTGAKTNRYPVLTPGAGADLSLSNLAAIRLHLDFPLLMRYSDTFTGVRASVGVALSFGNR